MLDYARFNQSVLGNSSVICLPNHPRITRSPLLPTWCKEFPVILYETRIDLSKRLRAEGVGIVYLTKPGPWDGLVVPGVKNCVHAQFLCDEFHGDAYAYLSPWMSRVMTGREDSYVPFFVPKLQSKENLRTRLKIPATARVFGRHGGWDTFNIPFVQKTLTVHARRHAKDHFVFLNTKPIAGTENLANVHYLPATVDPKEKAAFLATCDAMLHARWHGETFGLAVAEFAVLGKPVFTFGGSRERAHLELLGDCGRVYESQAQLEKMLANFQRDPGRDCPYGRFAKESTVMDYFQRKFLQTT